MVAEPCNKQKEGLPPGRKKANKGAEVKQIKFTAAFDGFTACDFKIFTSATYTDEGKAIPEVVFLNASQQREAYKGTHHKYLKHTFNNSASLD